jgi:DNA-binding MarR family transcriptional regulator
MLWAPWSSEVAIDAPSSSTALAAKSAAFAIGGVRDHSICLHVQRAARSIARRFDEALRPLELTNGQFSILMSLNRPKSASMGSVANLLAMDRTTLTAALKPLERRGLVTIAHAETDRRSRILILTTKGKALLVRAVPIWKHTHAEIEERLSSSKVDDLIENLLAIS